MEHARKWVSMLDRGCITAGKLLAFTAVICCNFLRNLTHLNIIGQRKLHIQVDRGGGDYCCCCGGGVCIHVRVHTLVCLWGVWV